MNRIRFMHLRLIVMIISTTMIILSSCKDEKSPATNTAKLLQYKTKATSFLHDQAALALQYTDSAFKLLKEFPVEESVKTEWLQLNADIYLALGQSDSAYNTFLTARDQAIVSNHKNIQAYADLWLGQQFTDDGKYFLAGKYLKEGLTLTESIGNEYQIARAHNLYGNLLSFNGDYQQAQIHLIQATGLFEKLGIKKALGAVYNNIANNYEATDDHEKTLFYFRKALDFSEQRNDTVNIISTLNNLGIHYRQLSSDSSEYYFNKALQFHHSEKSLFEIISVQFNLANLYFDRKEFTKAMSMYQQVKDVCMAKGIYSGLARTYNGIANIYEAKNEDIEAMNYYRKAYHLADSIGETPVAMVFLGNIQYMYEKQRNFEQALVSFKKIKAVDDSLLSLDKLIALHDLEMLYNKEKTEKENTELSSRILLQKSSLQTNRIILIIVLLSLIGLSILSWNIYKLYRQRDEAYKNLIEKYRIDSLKQSSEEKAQLEKSLISELTNPSGDPDYQRLIDYFEAEKPFLNSNLHFDDVALHLKISRKLLSHLLLEQAGMNFKTFVNGYRIREAMRLLAEPGLQHYKIEAIASQAGFGSKAGFYAAFSHATGSKPSEYR
ncbi:MAG: tetratricopeptide repeat protein [Bacteroidales bacterium]